MNVREHYFDVLLGYDCNAKCLFCSQELAWRRKPSAPAADVTRLIYSAYQSGYRKLGLLGGEITLRPDLIKLVAFARKCGFTEVRILTNGVRLAEPGYGAKLVAAGLNRVYFSLHGDDARLHDGLVGLPGAFAKALSAIEILRGMNVYVGVKILVNRRNYRRLPAIAEFFSARRGVSDIGVTYPLYTGDFMNHADQMAVALSKTRAYVLAAADVRPALHNFPPCVLPELLELNSDLHPETALLRRIGDDGAAANKVQPPPCRRCALQKRCAGVDAGYLARWGERELRPFDAAAESRAGQLFRRWRLAQAVRETAKLVGMKPPRRFSLDFRLDPRQDLLLLPKKARALSTVRRVLAQASVLWPHLPAVHFSRFLVERESLPPSRAMRELARMKTHLDRAIELDSGRAELFAWRAQLLHDLERADEALADVDRALELDPKHAWCRIEKADLLSELGRSQESDAQFDAMLRACAPGWVYAMRGRARAKCGRRLEALADFNRATRLEPKSANILAWRGELHRKLGNLPQALRDLTRSLRLAPDNSYARLWRAKALLAGSRWRQALADLNAAIRWDSRHLNLFAARAQALFMLGGFEAALRDLDRVHPLSPAGAWTAVAPFDSTQTLERALQQAAASHPGSPWPRALLGRVYLEHRDPGKRRAAVGELSMAIELDARCAWAYGWRGQARLRLGLARQAFEDIDLAARLEPTARHLAWRGLALRALGRDREALGDLDRACALEPDAGWIVQARGRAKAALGESGAAQDGELATLLDAKS